MGRNKVVKDMEKKYKKKKKKKQEKLVLIPTPSTMLNLACCDKEGGAFRLGRMVNMIGDSSSGKSILCLSVGAEICKIPAFKKYRIIYDDVENADEFDHKKLFGKKFAKKVEPPYIVDGEPQFSNTIEDFHCNINDALADGRPFIYFLDSFDALDSNQDIVKMKKMLTAHRKNTAAAGSYGIAKPRKASEILRNICGDLNDSESILVIISQTRDNINPMSFEKTTRSGGRALKFYATHEIWLAMVGKIASKGLIIGNNVKAKIKKNKLTGKVREIEFPIYYDYGVDDLTSCINFLVDLGVFKKTKNTISYKKLKLKGVMATVISQIEKNNLERRIAKLTEKQWRKRENNVRLNRKPKYQ